MDEKTILARLQNGENLDKIAEELTSMLNAASDEYNKAKAAEAEAQKKKEEREKQLDKIAADIAHDIADYIKVYAPESKDLITEIEKINTEIVKETIDSLIELTVATTNFLEMTKPVGMKKGEKVENLDPISIFLRELGL